MKVTPSHQLLHAALEQGTEAVDAWFELGLVAQGLQDDGQTDLTFALGWFAERAEKQHQDQAAQTRMARLAERLMAQGVDPHLQNAEGLDAVDMGAWISDPSVLNTMMTDAHSPGVDALMSRIPWITPPQNKTLVPDLWSLLIHEQRLEAVTRAVQAGGTLPKHALNWAHPDHFDSLIALGATWDATIPAAWRQRVGQGDLKVADSQAMMSAAEARFGPFTRTADATLVRKGRDLIGLIQKTSGSEEWAAAVAQAGNVSQMTVPYRDANGHTQAWPLLARLASLMTNTSSKEKQGQIYAFILQQFDALAPAPTTPVGKAKVPLSGLIWMVSNAISDAGYDLSGLEMTMERWAGPRNEDDVLKAVDAQLEGHLFSHLDGQLLAKKANRQWFEAHGHQPDAETQEKIKTRLLDPIKQAGFWTETLANTQKSGIYATADEGRFRVMQSLSDFEKVRSLWLARTQGEDAGRTWTLVDPWILAQTQALTDLHELETVHAILSRPTAILNPTLAKAKPWVQAQVREVRAGSPEVKPGSRLRHRP